jgi:hypothetical protein
MSQHLYAVQLEGKTKPQLRLLASYEAGGATLFARTDTYLNRSVEGESWDALWTVKIHVESGGSTCSSSASTSLSYLASLKLVMGMSVTLDNQFAFTVSADHIIGKIFLQVCTSHLHRSLCVIYSEASDLGQSSGR